MKKHNSNTSLTTRSKARRYMAVWTALVLSLCRSPSRPPPLAATRWTL